jgi:hypothetical protein
VAYLTRRRAHFGVLLIALSVSVSSCHTESSQPKEAAAQPEHSPQPKVIVKAPVSGEGHLLNTSVMFHDDAGQLNMTDLYFLINEPARGVDGTGGCVLWERRSTGDIFLLDDAGKRWLGPRKAGSDAVIVNSQCLVSLKNTGLAEVEGDLQMVVSVAFAKKFAGPRRIYAKAVNRQQLESNFTLLGSWTAN